MISPNGGQAKIQVWTKKEGYQLATQKKIAEELKKGMDPSGANVTVIDKTLKNGPAVRTERPVIPRVTDSSNSFIDYDIVINNNLWQLSLGGLNAADVGDFDKAVTTFSAA